MRGLGGNHFPQEKKKNNLETHPNFFWGNDCVAARLRKVRKLTDANIYRLLEGFPCPLIAVCRYLRSLAGFFGIGFQIRGTNYDITVC